MKITTILLIAFNVSVSAATFAQQISLSEKNAKLTDVLKTIRQQSGYDFVYRNEQVDHAKTVTIDLKGATLEQALKAALEGQGLSYTIQDGTVIIKASEEEKTSTFIDKIKAALAQVTIQGKVQDETGQPLVGATIKIKNTNQATNTDKNGAYTITVPDDKTVIAFSFVGYETQEYAAKDITAGSIITMKATETNLKEVVVSKGYYDEKRELLTGNVSTVTSKTIGQQPVSDPILTLVGRVPGLSINQNSGIAGASYTIQLRGKNSLVNGNNPLYIIDGVPYSSSPLTTPAFISGAAGATPQLGFQDSGLSPFNYLNPADIESIEVLKDADATAIYGSRGANGVILITTKKGKAGQTLVDVNINSGVGQPARTLDLLNTQQYLMMRREALKNDGIVLDPSSDVDLTSTWDTTRYTNWQKTLIGNMSHFTTANISLSGGNTNTQFLISGGYSKQTSNYPGNFNDQKTSLHVNLNHVSNDQKFSSFFSAQYLRDNNLLPQSDLTAALVTLAPDAPALYDQSGNINWQGGTWGNPLAALLKTSMIATNNLVSNLSLNYKVLPDLTLQSNLGYTNTEVNQSNQIPATAFFGNPNPARRSNNLATTTTNTWIIEPQVNYKHTFGIIKFDALIGSTFQSNAYSTLAQITSNYSSDELIHNIVNAGTATISSSSNATQYKYNALYSRLNLNWQDRYILNVTARRDGSSRFGPGKQFGNFGAVGAAWIFSKEGITEKILPFLSFGKLRASYGTTGSDQIADYQYLSSYSAAGNYQNTAVLAPTRIANPYYAWEVDKKLEGGLEVGFLSDRIMLNADYYQNRTGNQLVQQPLPTQDGFTSILANLPAVVQNSGWEFELNTVNIKKTHFTWSSSFNISINRNKLVSFPNLASNPAYATAFVIGQPITLTNLYHYTGVDPQTGLYTFQDVDGNGVLTVADKQLMKQKYTNYFGGFSNSLSYNGLQLDFIFQFVKQTGLSVLRSFGPGGLFNTNMPIDVLDRWQKPGDITNIAKFTTGAGPGSIASFQNVATSDRYTVDASFIRLKNVSLSYTIPVSWKQAIGVKSARIYLQGQNLLTITNYQGFDPESQGLSLPPIRMMRLGLQVSL